MTSDSARVPPAADRARSSSCFAPGARRWRRRGKTAASTDTPEPTLMTLIGPSPKREFVAGDLELALAFYRDDFVLTTDPEGQVKRSDFVRAADGRVVWFRDGGRMFARQP
jgi:hypothetical protein